MTANLITREDQVTTLLGEVMFLELLSRILYLEPDREWLESLIENETFIESPFGVDQPEILRGMEILQAWSRTHRQGIDDQDFADLKLDHTKLFIGLDTMPTAPWESVYFNRDRFVFQEQTLQVRSWYARFDLQAEKYNQEPDDHIGLELIFMAHLASLALQAIEEENQGRLDEIMQSKREFLSEHLLRWGPAWAKLVSQHASTDFYRGIAHLTYGGLLAMAKSVQIDLPKEAGL